MASQPSVNRQVTNTSVTWNCKHTLQCVPLSRNRELTTITDPRSFRYLHPMKKWILTAILPFWAVSHGLAQEWNSNTTTVEGCVSEVLRCISAPTEDWETFRGLFMASADFTVVGDANNMGLRATNFAMEDFIRLFLNSADRTIVEVELRKEIDEYNGIAHVWQTYEATVGNSTNRGINSYQLVWHNDRWWICNVIWSNDTNGVPIPYRYLPED